MPSSVFFLVSWLRNWCSSRGKAVPSLPEVKSSLPELFPSAREMIPSRSELNPSRGEVIPSVRELDSSRREVNPSAREVDPSDGEVNPSRSEVAPSRSELVPSGGGVGNNGRILILLRNFRAKVRGFPQSFSYEGEIFADFPLFSGRVASARVTRPDARRPDWRALARAGRNRLAWSGARGSRLLSSGGCLRPCRSR